MISKAPFLLGSLAFLFFLQFSGTAYGLSPVVKFPEWNSSEFKIQQWNPSEKLITLNVKLKANKINLSEVSSKIYWPEGFVAVSKDFSGRALKVGEEAVFVHSAKCPKEFSSWIECELKAQPDKSGLKSLIENSHSNEPITRKILLQETESINGPLNIGRTLPLYIDKNIAFSGVKELIFTSFWKTGKSKFFFWYPPENAGTGITSESLRELGKALAGKKDQVILTSSKLLLNRLKRDEEFIEIFSGKTTKFTLPAKTARELIEANLISLQIANSNDISKLEKKILGMKPCYSRPFLYANLASAYLRQGNKKAAKKLFDLALKEIPAWPEVIEMKNSIR